MEAATLITARQGRYIRQGIRGLLEIGGEVTIGIREDITKGKE